MTGLKEYRLIRFFGYQFQYWHMPCSLQKSGLNLCSYHSSIFPACNLYTGIVGISIASYSQANQIWIRSIPVPEAITYSNFEKKISEWLKIISYRLQSEVESSRTQFEVLGLGLEGQVLGLGLGLEASSPQKLACPRLEDSTIFWIVKILWSAWKIVWKTFYSGDRLKNFCEDLFFFFGEHLRFVSLVLGLEHSCPWPRERLSSERLSLALASDFFCVLGLGLEPCVLDSTSGYSRTYLA